MFISKKQHACDIVGDGKKYFISKKQQTCDIVGDGKEIKYSLQVKNSKSVILLAMEKEF